MSGTAISQLPAATSVINSDLLPVVEVGTPNVTKRLTIAQLLANTIGTNGGVFTGPVEFKNGITLDNEQFVAWLDSTGATQYVIALDGTNDLVINTPTAGAGTYFYSGGTTELAHIDNSGTVTATAFNASGAITAGTSVTASGSISATGAISAGTTITAANAQITSGVTAASVSTTNLYASNVTDLGNCNVTGTIVATGGIICGSHGISYSAYGAGTDTFAFAWSGGYIQAWVDNANVGNVALVSMLGYYLPLAGGTMTGALSSNSAITTGGTISCSTINTTSVAGNPMAFWDNNPSSPTQLYIRDNYATDFLVGTVSSGAYKRDISGAEVDCLTTLNALQPRSFRFGETIAREPVGLIAEEVEAVLPSGAWHTELSAGLRSDTLIALLVGAVQQLSARVAQLEAA